MSQIVKPSPAPPPLGNFADTIFLKALCLLNIFLMSAIWRLGRLESMTFLKLLPGQPQENLKNACECDFDLLQLTMSFLMLIWPEIL